MDSSTFVLLSGCVTYGIPLALAVRELLNLRTTPAGRDGPPPPPVIRPTLRPLPDCLMPPPTVRRPGRVLEDA